MMLRKYDCVNYNCCRNKNKTCTSIVGKYPDVEIHYSRCVLEDDGYCLNFKKGVEAVGK